MSKKKRAKHEGRQQRESAEEHLNYLKEEALKFFRTANPFEISCGLTERGVSTAHREGVFELLDAHFQKKWKSEHTDNQMELKSEQVVAHTWRREAMAKGRTPDADDLVFFIVGALHYSLKWSESRLALSQAELARREQDQVSVPVTN